MSILDENIPSQWISRSLGSMGEFFGGVTSITKEDYGYGTPFLPFKNVFNNSKVDINALELMNIKEKDLIKRNCTYGDIFFTASSETDDEVAMSSVLLDNVKSLTYNGFCKRYRLHSFNELNPNFVRYFFRSKVFRGLIKQVVTGDVRFNISQETLSNLKISIPENIKEQKAIAKVLTAFDDKIELLQAQNKTLETMAQTIFAAWFGKYQMGDELPEGWRVAKFNEFVKSSIGGDYGKETIEGDYTEETICLRGTDLPDMKMGTPKKAPIRFLKASKLERCKLENGDIVVEISGGTENQSTGRAMYINEKILSSANHPMTCVNFCRIIRPLKLEYSYFLHSLFDYLYTRKVFFNWENGTTGIKNLNLKALLEDFDLFIPKNEDSILDFNKSVKAVFNKIQTNNSQIQTLTKTRDTLLPKLMSGQVRVKDRIDTRIGKGLKNKRSPKAAKV